MVDDHTLADPEHKITGAEQRELAARGLVLDMLTDAGLLELLHAEIAATGEGCSNDTAQAAAARGLVLWETSGEGPTRTTRGRLTERGIAASTRLQVLGARPGDPFPESSEEQPIGWMRVSVVYHRPGIGQFGRQQTSKTTVLVETDRPLPDDLVTLNTWTFWGDADGDLPGTRLGSAILEEFTRPLACWVGAVEREQLAFVARERGWSSPPAATDPRVRIVPMVLLALDALAEVDPYEPRDCALYLRFCERMGLPIPQKDNSPDEPKSTDSADHSPCHGPICVEDPSDA
jgi:hypothetical protein